MLKINFQGLNDNAAHCAGLIVGALILRPLRLRFCKGHRARFWFSTVAANLAAGRDPVALWPYPVLIRR